MSFAITGAKGFHMKFANGYTISVQFGAMNYCENRSDDFRRPTNDILSKDAEVAVWDDKDNWISDYPHRGAHDDVTGYLTSDQVADIIAWVAGK